MLPAYNSTSVSTPHLSRGNTTATLPPYDMTPPVPSASQPPIIDSACSMDRVKDYLLLLSAFAKMLQEVAEAEMPCCHAKLESCDRSFGCSVSGCDGRMKEDCKVALFVEMAVRRFGYWQERLLSVGSQALPPLDVLLVWMTYMGSPLWYHDDTVYGGKLHPQSTFPEFPLGSVVECIELDTLTYSQIRGEEWKRATAISFNPLPHFHQSTNASITCPRCEASFSWPWMSEDGRGYAQCRFSTTCPTTNCGLRVTKEAMGVGRLARNLVKLYMNSRSQLGTRILTGGMQNHPLEILLGRCVSSERMVQRLGDSWAWRRPCSREFLLGQLPSVDKREINRLLSAFVGPESTSVDLGPATLRHIGYIDTLKHLGWLAPSTWVERSEGLQTARRRYSKFLVLAGAPDLLPVPTLGIEIIWQIHLLAGLTYIEQTKAIVGRVVDRDDAVEESHLAAAFRKTAERWKATYHVPYSTSGVLSPLELRGLAAKAAVKLHIGSRSRRLSIEKRIDYDNPIVYARADSALSLPCERNSVAIVDDDKAKSKRALRREEYEACRSEVLGRVEKGKVDPGLVEGLRDLMPAFVTTTHEDASCGPGGYPCSTSFLTVSGNHLSGRVADFQSCGAGLIGAGLSRRDDADVARTQQSTNWYD